MTGSTIIHNAGSNYSAWDIKIIPNSDFARLNDNDKLLYLVKFAVLAPSTHNTQPWKFSLDAKKLHINVYLNRNSVLPASDVVGRQSCISIGCAIENIVIAGEYFGLDPIIKYLSIKNAGPLDSGKSIKKSETLELVASIIFNPKTSRKNTSIHVALLKAILERKVERSEYDPSIIMPNKIIDDITKIADNSLVRLHLISDPIRKLSLAEFQAQADSYVINDRKFSRELGDWLLPNNTDSFVGMPGIGFNLQDEEALRIHKGLTGESQMQAEDGLKFALGGKIGIEKAPLVGVLTVAKDTPENWLRAGRVFERIFLILVSRGLSLAVHAGIAEVALINRIFSLSLGTTRKVVLVFRCGNVRGNIQRPHSPRLPAEKVIIDKS